MIISHVTVIALLTLHFFKWKNVHAIWNKWSGGKLTWSIFTVCRTYFLEL